MLTRSTVNRLFCRHFKYDVRRDTKKMYILAPDISKVKTYFKLNELYLLCYK